MSDWTVKIEYKNKNMETIVEKEYDFIQYTEMLRMELMRVILDIEDAFYYFTGEEQKDNWDEETSRRFKKIRHKLLDQANAVKRLPLTLSYKGHTPTEMSAAEFINLLTQNKS